MTDANEQRLGRMFLDWIASLPPEEILARYRALTRDDRLDIEGFAFEESAAVLNMDKPDSDYLEMLARCFDTFTDAEDVPPMYSSADLFRKRAHALRHPEEWREEQSAAAKRNLLSERRARALALASSCWADAPRDVRLRRIEEILPQLNQLAGEAAAEGNLPEKSAIAEDIVGLWRLRDALKQGP